MALTIRGAVPADEDDVVALWRACDLVVPHNDPHHDFRFAAGKDGSDILVGVDEEGCVAGAVMVGHDGHRGWLYYLASDPMRRGSGIGRRMVEEGEDWLRRRGVLKLQLMVRDTNTVVVSFYERLGFETAPRVVLGKWL